MFFVNGIPVATAELKTDFTQNITDAVMQYKHHRRPKGEPLLRFGSRALVHFAVSNSEVEMTTKLAGKDTVFLPFNRGNNSTPGTRPIPRLADGLSVGTILQRDTWLDILGRFMHLQVDENVDPISDKKIRSRPCCSRASTSGRPSPSWSRLPEPRAGTPVPDSALRRVGQDQQHLVADASAVGAARRREQAGVRLGHRRSPTATSSMLSCRRRSARSTAPQGYVAHIARLGGSKSQELADALQGGTKIIIVTIQTFPCALEADPDPSGPQGQELRRSSPTRPTHPRPAKPPSGSKRP